MNRQIINNQGIPNLTLQKAFDLFLSDCTIRNLSPATLEFYRRKLYHFLDYCKAQSVKNLDQVDSNFLRGYFLWLEEQGNNPGGRSTFYRSLRAAFLWLEREYDGFISPLRKVAAPKLNEQVIEGVSMEDVQALLKACKGDKFTSLRDEALILTLTDTGIRARELISLRWDDIDLNTGTVIIRRGKNGKPRSAFLSRTTRKVLRQYAQYCNSEWVWVNRDGTPATYDTVRGILVRRSQQAGLKSIPSPHDFRRAFAIEMLRSGCDVFTLQRLMGHADLAILRRYLAQTQGDLQQAHAQFSPVERMKQGRATK